MWRHPPRQHPTWPMVFILAEAGPAKPGARLHYSCCGNRPGRTQTGCMPGSVLLRRIRDDIVTPRTILPLQPAFQSSPQDQRMPEPCSTHPQLWANSWCNCLPRLSASFPTKQPQAEKACSQVRPLLHCLPAGSAALQRARVGAPSLALVPACGWCAKLLRESGTKQGNDTAVCDDICPPQQGLCQFVHPARESSHACQISFSMH